MHYRRSTLFTLILSVCCPYSNMMAHAQESEAPDYQSTVDRLTRADKDHITVLYESYLQSVEALGIDDSFTVKLRHRLLFDSDPVALIKGHMLVDLLTDIHAQSDADLGATTSLMLDLWKRFDEHIEAIPRPSETVYRNMAPPGGRYPSGIAPAAITEPDVRAAYEEMLRKNRKNAIQLNRAMRAEQAQRQFVSYLELVVRIISQDLSEREREGLLNAIKSSGRTGAGGLLEELRAKLP